MAVQQSQSFILRRVPLRETSWIITCFTRSFGKIKGIVKGARKEKSPWASSCELFTHSNVVFFEKTKTGLHLITEFSIIDSHEKLRGNLLALTYASYFSELVDELLEEGEPQPDVFDLLKITLEILETGKHPYEILARVFEIKLLKLLGLLPRFTDCMGCGSERLRRVYFSSRQGGVFCEKCYEKRKGGFFISSGCLNAIRFISKSDLRKAVPIRLGNQIRKELEQVCQQFIEFRIEHPMKSLKFLSQVRSIFRKK